jgi:hypothetical protein
MAGRSALACALMGVLVNLLIGGAAHATPSQTSDDQNGGFRARAYVGSPICEPGALVVPMTCHLPVPSASAKSGRLVASPIDDPLVVISGLDGEAPTNGAAMAWAGLTFTDRVPSGARSVAHRFVFDVDADSTVWMTRPGSFATLYAFGCVRRSSSSECLATATTEIARSTLGPVGPPHTTGWLLELSLSPPAGASTIPSGDYAIDFSLVSAVNNSVVRTAWLGAGTSQGGITLRSHSTSVVGA